VDHQLDTDSVWLRFSLITSKGSSETPSEQLRNLFTREGNVSVEKKTGNLIRTREKDSEEDGTRIGQWLVANTVLPDPMFEAVFSYTVPLDRIQNNGARKMVTLIGGLVRQAEFSPATSA
jgi:hypothetical protein